ncbi:hypothetical protein NQ318_006862 [Aromia moschata]|uniref:Uncharacterized protein n=1 Tax=Aromia moschata TaxID=1265417 RepID=A0AAV8YKJ0_9CUCU|nr:hypothetical protein NQ318_006862 [Aromia moschata]
MQKRNKVCYDHCISITFANDTPPPLYLCIECANEIHREHPNQQFFDILHPHAAGLYGLQERTCRSNDKSAISICFSTECASYNGNHPIRYCEQCDNNRHNNRRGGDPYCIKVCPYMDYGVGNANYLVEAIPFGAAKVPQKENERRRRSREVRKGKMVRRVKRKEGEGKSPVPTVDDITIKRGTTP